MPIEINARAVVPKGFTSSPGKGRWCNRINDLSLVAFSRKLVPCVPSTATLFDHRRSTRQAIAKQSSAPSLRASSFLLILKTEALESTMSQTTMTVRISGTLSEFVASNVGENGAYENISEYVRDLIRRDKERAERDAFDRLKAELSRAFAAPEASYKPLTAAEVIARNRV